MIVRLVRAFYRSQQPDIQSFLYSDEDYDLAPQQGMTLIRSTGEDFTVKWLKQFPHAGGPGFKTPTIWAIADMIEDDTYGTQFNKFIKQGWSPLNNG